MNGSTIMRNLEKQILGVGTSCIYGRFVQGEIWCKILRLASGEVLYTKPRVLKIIRCLMGSQ